MLNLACFFSFFFKGVFVDTVQDCDWMVSTTIYGSNSVVTHDNYQVKPSMNIGLSL